MNKLERSLSPTQVLLGTLVLTVFFCSQTFLKVRHFFGTGVIIYSRWSRDV